MAAEDHPATGHVDRQPGRQIQPFEPVHGQRQRSKRRNGFGEHHPVMFEPDVRPLAQRDLDRSDATID
jgi:hypothetical protein